MQQGSTLLKVVSIILIVFSALSIIASLALMVGGGLLTGASTVAGSGTVTIDGTTTTLTEGEVAAVGGGFIMIAGALALLSSVFELIIGIIGLKASAENGKHTAAFVLGIICVILSAITLIGSFVGGNGDMTTIISGLIGLVLPILYLVGVMQTRQGVE